LIKLENRTAEQVFSGGVATSKEGGGGKMVKEGEYGANTVYPCMYMEK
jgi:hypothetical protein